ncbi:MAG: HEAT repeat domain-containing protein [marine benthic group bacterium]|nr:HEAT repeat domain-containing protein [Gemmatimonadota bacterium]
MKTATDIRAGLLQVVLTILGMVAVGLIATGLLLGVTTAADAQTVALAAPAPVPNAAPAPQPAAVAAQAPVPNAAPAPQPADTIYKSARRALNQGQYEQAAKLFYEARTAEPQYAADALYYQALAYTKMGGRSSYREALKTLQMQFEQYPDAATHQEAESLAIRVQAELARLGDPRAAEAMQREAARMQAEMEREIQREVERAQRDAERAQADLGRQQAEIERSQARMHQQQEKQMQREQRAELERQHARQEAAHREAEMKMYALQALMESDPETAIPILENVLTTRTDETAVLRQQAVFLAARLDDDVRANDLMLDVLANDPDPEVRMHAAHWLARSDDPRAANALRSAAQSGDPELQEAAVYAIAQKPGPESAAALRDIASRPGTDPDIRAMAIHGLARHPSPESTRFLMEMFESLPPEEIEAREAALYGLAQSPGGVSGDFLFGIVSDPDEDPEIREMALFAAAQSGGISAGQFGQLYRDADSREAKEQLMFALTRSEDPEAFDVLLEIARTETDPELKQNAVFWIGRSEDPRAKELMLEILEQ